MRYCVIGAGMMGCAVAFDLVRTAGASRVVLADADPFRARAAAAKLGPTVEPGELDARDERAAAALMDGAAAVVSAVTYPFNAGLARAAIAASVHFCDLGGNVDIVDQELALDGHARTRGVTIVPDCGFVPGIGNILAGKAAGLLDSVDTIRWYDGGLPQHPRNQLGYMLLFSAEGLINEYVEPSRIVREGVQVEVDSMEELEEIEFPPFGRLEAFLTSGGASTLPHTFAGRVRTIENKTLRYPGHSAAVRAMLELGLASRTPIQIGDRTVIPRDVFAALLEQALPRDEADVILFRMIVTGTKAGCPREIRYELIDYYDPATRLTAMMRCTAFPASIVAQMLARGDITARGALPPERAVPPDRFVEACAARGIHIKETIA